MRCRVLGAGFVVTLTFTITPCRLCGATFETCTKRKHCGRHGKNPHFRAHVALMRRRRNWRVLSQRRRDREKAKKEAAWKAKVAGWMR